ncbi:hypothetical protein ACFWYW_44560 [Nonomuraea sp. NPDC059023]
MDPAGWIISAIGILIAVVIAFRIGRRKDNSPDHGASRDRDSHDEHRP